MKTFEEKYAPQAFGDLIFSDGSTRRSLEEFAKNQRHNSIILHGPYGTGKTATARILVEERSQGLEYGGVDFHRASAIGEKTFTSIANMWQFQSLAGVEHPVSIIDEIDQVKKAQQEELRWEVKERAKHGSFIFTTNKLHKVDGGLIDRCDVFELPAANSTQWSDRARWILDQEGVPISDTKLDALLDTCDGSIRDLMRALEAAALRLPKAV